MSFSPSSFIQYSISSTLDNTGAQALKLRFGSYSILVSPSPAAGIPDQILQQTPSTLMGEALFPFALLDIEQERVPILPHFSVIQFLSSFNLRSSYCEFILNKISSFAQQLAAGDLNVNHCIEVNIDRIKILWTEPISNVGILDAPSRRGAPDSAIERLRNQKIDVEEIRGDCTVCYENLKAEKEVTKMPCGHLYHESCIFTWLQRNNSCPLCRAPLQEQEH